MLLRLALRNLLRHWWRTGITIVAVAFGLALIMLSNTLTQGSYRSMVSRGVSEMAGHVVVQAEGYQEEKDAKIMLTGSAEIAATLRDTFPDATVVQRTYFQGLVTSPSNTGTAMTTGIEPAFEVHVSTWQDKLVHRDGTPQEGAAFLDDDPTGILLGYKLGESLEVEPGDKVVFMCEANGEMNSQLFRVTGFIKTGVADFDGAIALVTLPASQTLLNRPNASHQVSVHLTDPLLTDASTLAAVNALDNPTDLDILPWPEALPTLKELIELDDQSNQFILLFLAFLVFTVIINLVLMSVLSRSREFGVMRAVGMPTSRVFALIVLEGVLLGCMSAVVGFGFGLCLSTPLVYYGVDFSEMVGEGMEAGGIAMDAVIYGVYAWSRYAIYAALMVVMATIATLYPAFRTARLNPIDAMRQR